MDTDVGRAQTVGIGVKNKNREVRAKTYNKLFPLALGIVLGSAPMRLAIADGLQPCDSWSAGLAKDLSDDSKGSSAGKVVLSYLDLPGLSTGWGLQIVRSSNRFLLRTVQFRRDFRGGTVEIRPHVFGPNPVQPDPLVRTASISRSLAERLSAVTIAEIVQADQANARMGLDGESFYFYTEGKCAWAWSPDPGTKPERLADIFADLKTQSRLPTRLVQLFWEKRTLARLNHYAGSADMPLYQYLILTAVGMGVVVVGALPLLIAWIVTLIPKRLQRKLHFVLVSGALSYGFTCFLAVLLLPFLLLGSQVAAQFDVDGHSDLALALDVIVKYSVYVLLNAGLVFAIAVPIYLRRKWWTIPVPVV
jgi:hypothetical protein